MINSNNKKLKILYITQYFPPEIGATQTRAFEMAKNLVDRGHEVHILTEFPNHPSGIIPTKYKYKIFQRDMMDGIHVWRVWIYATPNKTFLTRMAFYLSFMFMSIFLGIFVGRRFDIVYATSPPFFVGFSGYILSVLKRALFFFEVRDIWPESAVILGELSNTRFINFAEKLELFYYRKAKKVVVVTEGIYERLLNRGIDSEKLEIIKNGTNTNIFYDYGTGKREELNLTDKYIVLYAGIFGIAQGMEQLCDLVKQMKRHNDIHFVFIGNGPKRKTVENLQKENNLINLTLLDEIPREQIAQYLSAAHVCIVPLKKIELFEGALPSKIFDYMACERPIILCVSGEASRMMKEAQAGITVEPENTEQMISAILKLKEDRVQSKIYGQNGRNYVEKNFSRKTQAWQLEKCMIDAKVNLD